MGETTQSGFILPFALLICSLTTLSLEAMLEATHASTLMVGLEQKALAHRLHLQQVLDQQWGKLIGHPSFGIMDASSFDETFVTDESSSGFPRVMVEIRVLEDSGWCTNLKTHSCRPFEIEAHYERGESTRIKDSGYFLSHLFRHAFQGSVSSKRLSNARGIESMSLIKGGVQLTDFSIEDPSIMKRVILPLYWRYAPTENSMTSG